jgi:uncharacterized protein
MSNRLARETSSYLLQHAHNPVDWYPWGPEALERARREGAPILVSIGYAACHWCHVMERESFEDVAIAEQMNQSFVNIKVDREERPDLDHVYQLVVQLMGRSGGWPLTVFLTPDQKPYFAGTYFPPNDRYGMPAFSKVLDATSKAYRERRGEVLTHATELTQAIEKAVAADASERRDLSRKHVERAVTKLVERFDERHGGFGRRPKFPGTMSLEVLLRQGESARVAKTLDAMRAGGICDQLGGGFHRYSTDERWLVPHFEKMLYDNALLLRLYAEASRALREPKYAQTAEAISAYVEREMTSPEGGFYATQDADSEGEEGRFFVWTPHEVDEACAGDQEAAEVAKRVYGVTQEGNFERSGSTVLSLVEAPGGPREAAALERARLAMFHARERRPRPARDDKLLASYGALMVSGLAHAAGVVGPHLLDAAVRAMRFIDESLVVRDADTHVARVLRHGTGGRGGRPGFLDDHAFVADAALDVYEITGDPRWVTLARSVADAILVHFHDPGEDAFFFTADDGEPILVRPRDRHDHAVPSGESISMRVLLRLGTLTDPKYSGPATRAVERAAVAAAEHPFGMSSAVDLVDRLVRGSIDVVLMGPRSSEACQALAKEVFRAYLPHRVVGWADPTDPRTLEACRALAEGKPLSTEPAAYVCHDRTCSAPIRDPQELARALSSAAGR